MSRAISVATFAQTFGFVFGWDCVYVPNDSMCALIKFLERTNCNLFEVLM